MRELLFIYDFLNLDNIHTHPELIVEYIINPMCKLCLSLLSKRIDCHSEGAERLENPFSDLVGLGLRDTSAPFYYASG